MCRHRPTHDWSSSTISWRNGWTANNISCFCNRKYDDYYQEIDLFALVDREGGGYIWLESYMDTYDIADTCVKYFFWYGDILSGVFSNWTSLSRSLSSTPSGNIVIEFDPISFSIVMAGLYGWNNAFCRFSHNKIKAIVLRRTVGMTKRIANITCYSGRLVELRKNRHLCYFSIFPFAFERNYMNETSRIGKNKSQ